MAQVQLAKGVRDFAPNEKIARNYLVDTLKKLFENYGFNPIETPIIERLETLTAKSEGGETLTEIFKFKDQGDREIALRFDLTVPLARFVAMNPNLKMPFKRYQIGRVFRDGPIKLGRYREFWQCDIDVVGSSQMIAEAEILSLVKDFFSRINLDVDVLVNNRLLLNKIIKKSNLPEDKTDDILQSIDKLEKINSDGVKKELLEKGFEEAKVDELLRMLDVSGDDKDKLEYFSRILPEAEEINKIKELLKLVDGLKFTPELARGLNYYTGTVFEVKLKDQSKFSSSLAGGGRYDDMIGNYADNGKDYPAVGIAFGLEPILEVLKMQNKIAMPETVTKLLIASIGNVQKESLEIANMLRTKNINVEIDLMNRKLPKNIKYALSQKIPFVLFVGENELAEKKFKLKNMLDNSEEILSLDEIINKLKC